MSLINGVSLVTTPIALLAFIVAAAFYAYRETLLNKRKTLQKLPATQRTEILHETLRLFDVDTNNLSARQQYEIALVQIRARERRVFALFATICFLTVLFTVPILFATLGTTPSNQARDDPSPHRQAASPRDTAQPALEEHGPSKPIADSRSAVKEPSPELQVNWQILPDGSKLGNRTSMGVTVFAKPDLRSEEITKISPGATISPKGAEQQIARAMIQGTPWYRFTMPSGRVGYVPVDALILRPTGASPE